MRRGARARLRVDQRRPDLRPAAADAGLVRAHAGAGARAAARPHRAVCLCAPAAALQAAAPHRMRPSCRDGRRQARHARAGASPPSGARGYVYIGMDHFALPERRAGRGQAPGPAAPQLPGLQHAARLRPDRPRACRPSAASAPPTARTPRRWPSTTTRCGQGRLPVVRGLALDARRPGAPRRDHGADVPGRVAVRIDRGRAG